MLNMLARRHALCVKLTDIPVVLCQCRQKGVSMALASRTPTPDVARAFLEKLGTPLFSQTVDRRVYLFACMHVYMSLAQLLHVAVLTMCS